MKIMFVGSEATPFIKTGGLADVLGSLPHALAGLGNEVSLVLPAHQAVKNKLKDQTKHVTHFNIMVASKEEYVGIEHLRLGEIDVYFIDNDYYFGNRTNVYGDFDDGERYGFFNQAVLFMMRSLDYYPDIVHVNDWPTGLIPYYLKSGFMQDARFDTIKSVYTIHNIAYQGWFSTELFPYINLMYSDDLIFDGQINFLKTGLVSSNQLTTVSKTYAEELMHDYYAFGMGRIIRSRRAQIEGIMNGLDNDEFDPRKDQAISKQFGLNNYQVGKNDNKKALLRMFHLNDYGVPIIAMVSRLTEAKGFPLVEGVIESLLQAKQCQFILLGSGDESIQGYFNHLRQKYPRYVGVYFGYSDAIARQIYAGANFFLMPSRFEPCGLAQLISMRYGTLPIVRETGGLKDSVLPYNKYTHDGTGFSFMDYSAASLKQVLNEALELYSNKAVYKKMVHRVMKENFSWEKSAKKYHRLYEKILEG